MKLVAALLLAFVIPASAGAALEVKLSVVPPTPREGGAARIELRPYWTYNRLDGSCCRLKPAAVNYPFKVEAVAPSGQVYVIHVRRTLNRFLWSSGFRFGAVGRWVIRAPQWGPRYSRHFGARPRIHFRVRP